MVKIVIEGRPVPAVRMTQRGKWLKKAAGRYLAYKNQVAWAAKAAKLRAGIETFTGPVEFIATVYLYGNREPDADNVGKALTDSLNGIIWVDDRQITDFTVRKRKVATKDEERAEIIVREAVLDEIETAEGA
ncbi:RusA family crossover junction endodeoxyribonuclease [Staphylospora marina]|uniref:RusA family crossover junction endodeoxyribonuclease n=1 Tax=Staphylospora marina TaxID=2490858 RepID=UPI0013DE2610|nr:RusA family crossover junction endodeoxyribonuclease [Staphylospora marina]